MNLSRSAKTFLLAVLALFVVRLLLVFISVPVAAAAPISAVLGIIFVGFPILALFLASREPWPRGLAATILIIGIAMHVFGAVVPLPKLDGVLSAIGQSGLMLWCCGLGALLASIINDKNLLVPLSIFLAGFDAFLILNPDSLPRKIMEKSPGVFTKVAAQVPSIVQKAPGVTGVAPSAFVGPADFIFLTMFFMALFKFRMRTSQTLTVMIPVLVAYLFTVVVFGSASIGPMSLSQLPALVPIGLVILLVNWKEFNLNKQELASTLVVAVMSVTLASYGFSRAAAARKSMTPESQPVPSKPVPAPEATK
jgi:hypothetical protein